MVQNSPFPCLSYTSRILVLMTSFHYCQNTISSLGCHSRSAFVDGRNQYASEFCVRWCLWLWNSAMWVAGFPQQQPYRFHCRNRVLNARQHFICKNVGPFDNFTAVQRHLSTATSPDRVQAGTRSSYGSETRVTSALLHDGVGTKCSLLRWAHTCNVTVYRNTVS
jgi:hypothetical protein